MYIYSKKFCSKHCHLLHASLFDCFVALRPKSTAMVMVGQSVHLTTFFPITVNMIQWPDDQTFSSL